MTERLIAAWDTRPEDRTEGSDLPEDGGKEAWEWMKTAFPSDDSRQFVYRTEFLETPQGYQVRAFRYAADDEGKRYAVDEYAEDGVTVVARVAAIREPVTFPLAALPPSHLIGGKQ